MNKLKDVEKAYIAGIIDGEGCISITRSHPPKNRWVAYSCSLYIANTNLELLKKIQMITDTAEIKSSLGLSSKSKKCDGMNWKQSYLLRYYSKSIRLLLPEIKDYLLGKQQQATYMMEFLTIRRGRGWGSSISEQDKARRDQIVAEMHKLNKRGIW